MTEKEYAWLAYLSRKNEIMCLRLIGQLENEQLRQEVRSIRGNFSLENLQRFGIIEKRGWVTIDGNHVLIEGEAAVCTAWGSVGLLFGNADFRARLNKQELLLTLPSERFLHQRNINT